ncbi:uncharacterized protein [Paramormyrops kingsleyae]|uniref:uncharacterized protein isoform X2 n=1 Tax=Paramormyrops kingsleyae TaxID=1676925 RepID=UPI000CD60971|nr:CDP-diacylglycerol--inositol 3-phosphatidyltransferase 1-like isoform X2 [Paramormyrops kingsleyae]
MGLEVLLYVPNLIGYIRVLLVLAAWAGFNNPEIFVPCYGISVILDGVDGFVARRLKQTSELGAWLDVVIDNTGRGMLWSMLFQMGILTQILHLPAWLQTLGTLLLSMGRLLCLSVEIWCIWTHVRFLTRNQTLLKKVE